MKLNLFSVFLCFFVFDLISSSFNRRNNNNQKSLRRLIREEIIRNSSKQNHNNIDHRKGNNGYQYQPRRLQEPVATTTTPSTTQPTTGVSTTTTPTTPESESSESDSSTESDLSTKTTTTTTPTTPYVPPPPPVIPFSRMKAEFDSYIIYNIASLGRVEATVNNFCLTKYCSYGRDVASENPDGDAPKIFETPFKIENEDQTAKENLEDHEAITYQDYVAGLQSKHNHDYRTKLHDQCITYCQKIIVPYANTRRGKEYYSGDNSRNFQIFDRVFNHEACVKLKKQDKNAQYYLASICESISVTQGINFCWNSYSSAALQACNMLDNLEQNKPLGYLEQAEKESLLSDNYTHAIDWFKKKGEFNCSDCTSNYPSEYNRAFCNFQFEKDKCGFLFDKAKLKCLNEAELLSKACYKYGFGACLNTCTIGRDTLSFYVAQIAKSWIPNKFKSTDVNECPEECKAYNAENKIYDLKDMVVGEYFNNECDNFCEKFVHMMLENKGKMNLIFKVKVDTVLTRIENKQEERDHFDDQHVDKTKEMSFRYNRDTIYDAIILMENEIYEEQDKIIEENDVKAEAEEEDIQTRVIAHYASEADFDYFDEELNVFDLIP
jgi:hypothetical protein